MPKGTPGRPECVIDGCSRLNFGHGWCNAHYARWRKHGDPLGGGAELPRGRSLEQRFWAKVDRNGPTPVHRPELGPCWQWTGAFANGYGRFGIAAGNVCGAHRLSYEIANGPILDNALWVCHHCDNRRCVNPGHLFLGTPTDNHADMWAKGRGRTPRGEDRGNAKLTEPEVHEIRRLYALGGISQRKLAARFGVGYGAVRGILSGANWNHI